MDLLIPKLEQLILVARKQVESWEAVMQQCATTFTQMRATAALPTNVDVVANRRRIGMLEGYVQSLYKSLCVQKKHNVCSLIPEIY